MKTSRFLICFFMLAGMSGVLFAKGQVAAKGAPNNSAILSQAISAGDFLFISGQLPIDLATGKLVEGGIEEQTLQTIQHIKTILADQNLTLEDVVKVEVFLKDLNDVAKMNEVYISEFDFPVKPARFALEVARLPRDSLIEISCIAYAPKKRES